MNLATSQNEFVIGIDAGGTHTRVGCFDLEGTCLSTAVGGGGGPHHNDDALENVRGTIAEALHSGGLDPARAVALVAGIAGVTRIGSNQSHGNNDRAAILALEAAGITTVDAAITDRLATRAHSTTSARRPMPVGPRR